MYLSKANLLRIRSINFMVGISCYLFFGFAFLTIPNNGYAQSLGEGSCMINSEKIYIGYQQLFDDQWPKSIADALLNEVIQNREIQKNFKKQCKPGLYIRKIRNRGEVHFRRNALNREFREALEKTNLFWEIKEKQKRKTPTSLRKNSLSRSQEERWDKCGLHPPEFLIGIHITLRPSPKDQNTIGCSILLEVTNIEKGTSN